MNKNNRKIELLSPAGDFESLKAGVSAGADAVYAGGSLFSARARASNFDDIQMVEAVSYAHLRGVNLYIAVNTLIKDEEMKKAVKYVQFLQEIGVDAVIMQDIGLIKTIRDSGIDIPVHFSTQSTITTHHDIKSLSDLGVSRIVLPREMDINTISKLHKNTNLELEAFIHGALCVCYSGKCLFSSLEGGRSGNRGSCAQICRKPYDIYVDNSKIKSDGRYLLSPKDLCTISDIDKIIDSKVKSLKIEGRMKSKEYIYQVTRVYRYIIDRYISIGKIDNEDIQEAQKRLSKVFNRSFTKGYILKEKGKSIMNPYFQKPRGEKIADITHHDKKNHKLHLHLTGNLAKGDGLSLGEKIGRILTLDDEKVDLAPKGKDVKIDYVGENPRDKEVYKTFDKMAMDEIEQNLKIDKKTKVNAKIKLHKGHQATIVFTSGSFTSDEIKSEEKVQKADKSPLKKVDILEKISKLGGTSFTLEDLDIDMEDDVFIPISAINHLKRRGIESLEKRIISSYKRKKVDIDYDKIFAHIISRFDDKITIYARVEDIDAYQKVADYLDKDDIVVTYEKEVYDKAKNNHNTYMSLDEVIDYESYDNQYQRLVYTKGKVFTSTYAFGAYSKDVVVDGLLNSYNSFTHNYYHSRGNKSVMSYENIYANQDFYYYIKDKTMLIVPAYTYPPYMITKFCPHKDEKGVCMYDYHCKLKDTQIANDEGKRFTFRKFGRCKTIIYPAKPKRIDYHYLEKLKKNHYTNYIIDIKKGDNIEQIIKQIRE